MEITGRLTTHSFENGTETLLQTEQYGGQEYTCHIASTGAELYRVLYKTGYGSDTGRLVISSWDGRDWQETLRRSSADLAAFGNGCQVVAAGSELYIILSGGGTPIPYLVFAYSAQGNLMQRYTVTSLGLDSEFFGYNGQLHVSEKVSSDHFNQQVKTLISSIDNSGNRTTLVNTGSSKVILDYSVTPRGIVYSSGTTTYGAQMYMFTDVLTDITLYENGTDRGLDIYLDSVSTHEADNLSMGFFAGGDYYRFGHYFIYNDTLHYLGHAIPDGDIPWDDGSYKIFFAKYKE